MNVGIDQPRHQRRISQIDGFGAGGMGNRGAGSNDFLTFNQDFARGNDASGFDIQKAGGMKHDGVRGRRSLGLSGG